MNPPVYKRHPQPSPKPRPAYFSSASVMLLFFLWFNCNPVAAEEEKLRYFMLPGDNPWNITERLLRGMQYWQPLLRMNNITLPNQLPPGTELSIPLSWLRTEAATARVKEAAGDSTYISAADGQTKSLQPGIQLRSGDKISIGEKASAIIEFSDGSLLLMGKNSKAQLERVEKFSDTGYADSKIELERGRTENQVEKRGTRFEIETPSASTAVRGTQFRASVDAADNSLSRFEVLAGSVAVKAAEKTRGVRAGFGTRVQRGEPPAPPTPLLPAPKFEVPADLSRDFPLEIRWQAVAGAESYRLAVEPEGSDLLSLDETTTRTNLSTDALADGRYTLRLRAIDKLGLEGREVVHQFVLDAQPQPPLAVTPEPKQVVRTEVPVFEWTRPLGGSRTHFQLTPDTQSTPLIEIQNLTAIRFVPESLPPGSYHWRLASHSESEQGPWGEYQSFTLKPAPAEPEVTSEGDDRQIRLHWPDAGDDRRYRVQISESSEFQTVTTDQIVDQPVWEMERSWAPTYFKVRVIEADGYEGGWSAVQMIDPIGQPWYVYIISTALLMLLAI